jgi:CheY-like chemotaxis protein
MSKSGPLVIVEDDPDDQEMISRILSKMKLQNEILKFYDGEQVLEYLRNTKDSPFIIISDINMPIMNGIQLKEKIDDDPKLKRKSIPFVYLSTTASPQQVIKAYELTVQGFFVKGQSYDVLKAALHQIVAYWQTCVHPNNLI